MLDSRSVGGRLHKRGSLQHYSDDRMIVFGRYTNGSRSGG